jgi:hypothetical protein
MMITMQYAPRQGIIMHSALAHLDSSVTFFEFLRFFPIRYALIILNIFLLIPITRLIYYLFLRLPSLSSSSFCTFDLLDVPIPTRFGFEIIILFETYIQPKTGFWGILFTFSHTNEL